jgi:hypothetical protein
MRVISGDLTSGVLVELAISVMQLHKLYCQPYLDSLLSDRGGPYAQTGSLLLSLGREQVKWDPSQTSESCGFLK